MEEKEKYPYLETEIHQLKFERWMAVRDYESYYEVSSLGRVRSLDRYIPHPRLGQQFVAQRILHQKIILHRNIKTGSPSVDLQVALSKDGKTTFHNVRRLVYAAFRRELNYEKDHYCIINVNGDGYDCTLKNLKLVTVKEKSQRAFDRDRVVESSLKTADRSKWKKTYGGYSRQKPVLKTDLKGNILSKYKSISEASRKNKVGEKEIIGVAKGRWSQWNGFVWEYANAS
jgi:hypothetical protein